MYQALSPPPPHEPGKETMVIAVELLLQNIHLSTYPSFHLCREPVWDVQLSLPLARFFFQVCFTKTFFLTGLGGGREEERREGRGGGKEKEGKEWGGGGKAEN